MAYKCMKKTKHGKRCRSYALIDSKFCFTHDPKRAGERRKAHSLGGLRRRQASRRCEFPAGCDPTTIPGLMKVGAAQIKETWKLSNSVGRARAMSQMMHVQESLIELANLAAREAKFEREEKSRGLRHRRGFAFFDDDHNPFEDATDAELIKMYQKIIAEREKLESSEDDEQSEEDQAVASVDESADS